MAELWNAGDLDPWLDEVGPDFEFTPDPSFPDHDTYRGEEFRKFMQGWVRTWEDNRFEMLGFEEIGDVGLIRSRWHLAARGSGGEVPVADFTLVLWWDGPDAVNPHRMAAFFDDEHALAAARGTG
jgi:ketosteroid isomerase-like protein